MHLHLLSWSLAITAAAAAVVHRTVPRSGDRSVPSSGDHPGDLGALSFNITALNGRSGRSVLECWRLTQRFGSNNQPGTIGALDLPLGGFSEVHMSVIPAQFDGGLHNAPVVQLVWFISGLAHITLPESNDEAWLTGGPHGLIAAVDTSDVSEKGHITRYPGSTETVGLIMPLVNWSADNFTVLHDGPCAVGEMSAF